MLAKNFIMFRYLIIFVGLVFLMLAPLQAKERIALVIGNAAYKVGSLKNPTNDANDIASVLRKLGFNVMLETDATQTVMEKAIHSFGDQLHNDDVVGLFYYSGHGVQYAGENYLIPIGAMEKVYAPGHLRYKTVGIGYVLEVMKQAGNGLNIVILDACRNNPFKSFSKSLDRGLAVVASVSGVEGTLIAYATSPGKIALDGSGRNSPYTKHLLRFMQQPNLPIEKVLKKVRSLIR